MNELEPTAELVRRAAGGDQGAWNALVERYGGLVVSIARRFRLPDADVHDVSQSVWLSLVEHLSDLRDPSALPGWLATTTRYQCLLVLRTGSRHRTVDLPVADLLDDENDDVGEALLQAERHAALRGAFRELSPRCQELLGLLVADDPVPYVEIGRRLGMKVGSIGPTRARCLEKLRSCPTLVAYLLSERDETIRLDNEDESRNSR